MASAVIEIHWVLGSPEEETPMFGKIKEIFQMAGRVDPSHEN